MTESEILDGCRAFDEKSQKLLYNQFAADMYKICLRYTRCRQDALEILNSAFYKVFSKIKDYNGTGTLKAWISKIMVTTSIDFYRQQKRMRIFYVEQSMIENEVILEAEILESSSYQDILDAVQALPEMNRLVLNLFAIEGFSHKEIASMLQISETASRWHLSRARELLKKKLLKKKSFQKEYEK